VRVHYERRNAAFFATDIAKAICIVRMLLDFRVPQIRDIWFLIFTESLCAHSRSGKVSPDYKESRESRFAIGRYFFGLANKDRAFVFSSALRFLLRFVDSYDKLGCNAARFTLSDYLYTSLHTFTLPGAFYGNLRGLELIGKNFFSP
jgi:hypothetical protein